MTKKILLLGESWTIHSIHQKGFDSFTTTTYQEGIRWFQNAVESKGYQLIHIPNHRIQYDFELYGKTLDQFDVIILSDIGSNTLLVSDKTFNTSQVEDNKLDLIERYVKNGGKLVMIGGYMAFSGINGSSRYEETVLAKVLPVECLGKDDRIEMPQGIKPEITEHEIFAGLAEEWPKFLGYNKTVVKPDAEIVATINGDPFIAFQNYGSGKAGVFTSDFAPHWGTEAFINWTYYASFWDNFLSYLLK
ncbi:glutamine amidotransferase [Paucilactobacillus sp. N302-9]